MIGMYSEHSDTFLRVVTIAMTLAFSIPITIMPLTWARILRWDLDEKPHLALYFGRSLGVLALVMSWAGWHAAGHAAVQPFFFNMLISLTVLMIAVHVAGALQKVQPWTETAEILLWAVLAVMGFLFYPAAGA
jgi:hypothetical protein